MFEKASRLKLRFKLANGTASVEDLWDLSLTKLDNLYKAYNKLAKAREEEGLMAVKTQEDTTLALRLDIIKYVFSVKKTEADNAKNAAAIKAQKQKLLSIAAEQEDAELRNLSADKLKEMAAALDANA